MKTHGLSRTRLYYVWRDIKNRCYRRSMPVYKWYGGRGIRMCDEWKNDASAFISWCKANGYEDGLQINRIDNNKGYSPDNCRLVKRKVNLRNTSANVRIQFDGMNLTVIEWSEVLGISANCIYQRLNAGWDIATALLTPVNKNLSRNHREDRRITYRGETHTLSKWAQIKGLNWWTVQNRVRLGWSPERIFTTPEKKRKVV